MSVQGEGGEERGSKTQRKYIQNTRNHNDSFDEYHVSHLLEYVLGGGDERVRF